MFFVNPTPFSANLYRTTLDDTRIMASAVIRVAYRIDGSRLAVADDQPWIVSTTPWDSPAGPTEEDGPYMRGGVDVFVFGHAQAPGRRPVKEMEVGVQVGRFVRRAVVSGNRVWVRNHGGVLVPSEAVSFERMPLTLERAYGGTAEWDGIPVPFSDNPGGKGFYLAEEQAEGRALPNLEEPDRRVQRWNDVPPVCGFGFCPRVNSQRIANGTVLDDAHRITALRPQLFNQAFPAMIAPSVTAGERVVLWGFSRDARVEFDVPAAPVQVRLRFGQRDALRVPLIDQIGVEVDLGRVFITWRFPFRYTVRARERRECHLLTSGA